MDSAAVQCARQAREGGARGAGVGAPPPGPPHARADTESGRANTKSGRADTESGRADTESGRADTEYGRAGIGMLQ